MIKENHKTRTMRNILLGLISKNTTERPAYGYGELNEEIIKKIESDELETIVNNAVKQR